MKIFVYGTLLKGLSRNRKLSRSQFIGAGVVRGVLYDLGAFPALLETEDNSIAGELYEVDERTLWMLDDVESYDSENSSDSLYIRKDIDVLLTKNNEIIKAQTYIYNRPLKTSAIKIVSGNYFEYQNKLTTE